MAIPNLIALLALNGVVVAETKKYLDNACLLYTSDAMGAALATVFAQALSVVFAIVRLVKKIGRAHV